MSESKQPPRLPEVVDEAGPTPSWVPWLGFGLLCALVLFLVARETGLIDQLGLGTAAAAPDAGVAAEAAAGAAAPAAGSAAKP